MWLPVYMPASPTNKSIIDAQEMFIKRTFSVSLFLSCLCSLLVIASDLQVTYNDSVGGYIYLLPDSNTEVLYHVHRWADFFTVPKKYNV